MWTRKGIKDYAKDFLRKHYWKAFLVCLIATLLSGGGGGGTSADYDDLNLYSNQPDIVEEFDEGVQFDSMTNNVRKRIVKSPLYYIAGGSLLIIVIVSTILLITVGYAIEVGKSRFFLDGFEENVRIKKVFSTFNTEEYFFIVKTQLLRTVYNFLWILLFIIPGIVKAYEYRMVPYILSEKPDLSSNEVITKSKEITYGHKMDMFVLDLSFIGWHIAGVILLGLGGLLFNPYFEATYARLYNILSGNVDSDREKYETDNVIVLK